ncbi:MAG TPA: DUF2203 domain-containing protein [Dehalococcoidia bacterium]
MPKYFTRDEANQLLPFLRQVLPEIAAKKRDLDAQREVLGSMAARSRGNGHALEDTVRRHEEAYRRLAAELRELVERVQATGCEVKDPDVGLIDFPSLREGRVVYLCWRLDEPEVAWWHELDTGFAGRQPL